MDQVNFFCLLSVDTLKRIRTEISGHLVDLSKDIAIQGNRSMIRSELDILDNLDHVLDEKGG